MLRPIAIFTALIALSVAGSAIAAGERGDSGAGARVHARPAPISVPAEPPVQDRAHPEAYGYRTSDELAAALAPPAKAASSEPGVVTVTATVLPVRTIVVDRAGSVRSIYANTDDRTAGGALYVVRLDSLSGEAVELSDATWSEAALAFSRAHARDAATGLIYSR